MKILITGGHLTPALAVIDEIKRRNKKIEIIFVGRKYALDTEKTLSLEYKEICSKKIPFITLQAGRLSRIVSTKTIRSLIRIPLGFFYALKIILIEKPDLLLSFGGYIAVPVAFWSWLMRIPIYTHEQTIRPGLANRIISFFAKKTFIAFEESRIYFDKTKTILVGNPIRKSIFKTIKKPFTINKDRPVIYITGGSLGSHSINEHIKQIIAKLLNNYIVIHQVGETKEYNDFEYFKKIKNKLPLNISSNYIVKEHFFENEIGYIYSLSDLVISRAGANTFFELLMLKKPTIFIPLPWSSYKEQTQHAKIFEKVKVGKIFNQNQNSRELLLMIEEIIKNIDIYKKNFSMLKHLYKYNASQFIVDSILP